MYLKASLFFLLSFFHGSANAQFDMSDYAGGWEADIDAKALSVAIIFNPLTENAWEVSLANKNEFYKKKIVAQSSQRIALELTPKITFNGEMSEDKESIKGFLFSSTYFYSMHLQRNTEGKYVGQWNTFYVDELKPSTIYLWIENGEGERYEAYPMFPDNRYRGTYARDFEKDNDQIQFIDSRAGYQFKGKLGKDKIAMDILLAGGVIATVNFTKSTEEWPRATSAQSENQKLYAQPVQLDDGWESSTLSKEVEDYASLQRMADSIQANALTEVHSVLIARKGKLIFEQYYSGFHKDLPQDQRSAAKSIASAMVGIAQADGYIGAVENSIFDYLPANYQYTRNEKNASISLKHLLTMSSGMDAIDFGTDRVGKATEDLYQNTDDWLKTVLEAPMLFEPGAHCNYGSANPYLLGVALSNEINQPVEQYMDEKLFGPLGITNYTIPADPERQPYFGGGMYLIPRDMLKFGELYRCQGKWQGKQIIPKKWVTDSFKSYNVLENTTEKNGYGYLWWHEKYEVNGQQIASIEARGAGGQNICVFPELETVIVITSGNYRNGRYWQPQLMLKDYILPALVK